MRELFPLYEAVHQFLTSVQYVLYPLTQAALRKTAPGILYPLTEDKELIQYRLCFFQTQGFYLFRITNSRTVNTAEVCLFFYHKHTIQQRDCFCSQHGFTVLFVFGKF